MYYKSKYIVIDGHLGPMPVVFSDLLGHADVAAALRGKVVGAGFCFIKDNKYRCWGESISLRVKSREVEDERILNKYLGAVVDDDL